MSKPSESISRRDEIQRGGNGLLQGWAGAGPYPPQHGLQFGESLFNGRQIRRVSRQEQKTTAAGFNDLLDTRSQVNREIIQDHDLPGTQTGCKDLLDVDLKSGAISRSIQHQCRPHEGSRQRGDHGHDGDVNAGDLAYCALPSWGIGIQWGHGDVGTSLGDFDQVLTRQGGGLCAPGGAFGFFLLSRSYDLFFRVQPRVCLARVILAGLTLTPWEASHMWQCCSRVAS